MKSKIMKMMVVSLALISFGLVGCEEKGEAREESKKQEVITAKDDGNSINVDVKNSDEPVNITVKDADGNVYPAVKIGSQIWMAKNLNYKIDGSVCYDDDDDNCDTFGRLYTWNAAMKACPSGWHLPSREEFGTLRGQVGSSGKERSENLRAAGWKDGADRYGFSALPAGHNDTHRSGFSYAGSDAGFWSSTMFMVDGGAYDNDSYFLSIDEYTTNVSFIYRDRGLSVRCLLDSNEDDVALHSRAPLKDSRDGKAYKTVKIGELVWMAENLNFETDGSMCNNNEKGNCEKFGRLYTWNDAKGACPSGWHLPSEEEFKMLLNEAGSSDAERSDNLKVVSWDGGTDRYGFSALPAGGYASDSEEFYENNTCFWSFTENSNFNNNAHYFFINVFNANVSSQDKNDGCSVRCLQD